MFPNELFLDITWYEIFVYGGMIAALVLFDFLSGKKKMPAGSQKFFLILGVVSIMAGVLFAMIFQWFYTLIETGRIPVFGPMTFMGGLAGGIGCFLLGYKLTGSAFMGDSAHADFQTVKAAAPASIAIAHCLGRIGCFSAGCCHGKESDTLGMFFQSLGIKVVPLQLFEAIFLAILCAALIWLCFKRPKLALPVYLAAYGLWRFIIEFFRGDDRGKLFIPGLSPSQHLCIVMVAAAAVLLYFTYQKKKAASEEQPGEDGE